MTTRHLAPAGPWLSPAGKVPALEHGQIHVWRISIDAASPRELIAARRALLTPAELVRAGRFYTSRLADQWVLGRGALRAILSRYTGVGAGAIVLETETHGKPVMRMPRAQGEAPSFNLSHAGDVALMAVTRTVAIGVDIERIREMRDGDRVAKRFFSEAEYAQYAALPPDERATGFFRCWTRKEAFIKAIGEGLSRPLSTFDVTLRPGDTARLVRVKDAPDEAKEWSMHAFEPATGYMAAVIARTPRTTVAFFDLV